MESTLEITVTQEDIDLGVPKSGVACPIAIAFARALDVQLLGVGNGRIWFRRHSENGVNYPAESYNLPEQANRFIQWFDVKFIGKYLVRPLSFTAKASKAWFHHDY